MAHILTMITVAQKIILVRPELQIVIVENRLK